MKLLLSLLLACPLMQAETAIMPLSEEKVQQCYEDLSRKESRRHVCQLLLGVGGMAAVGYYLFGTSEQSEIQKLNGRVLGLEARLHNATLQPQQQGQSAVPAPSEGWFEWGWSKTTGAANWVVNRFPGFMRDLLVAECFTQASRALGMTVPSLGGYLFEPRTMVWHINKNTQFINSIQGLMNWVGNAMQPVENDLLMEDLVASMNCYIQDVERVLGYMKFMEEKLDSEQKIEKHRAKLCIDSIHQAVAKIVDGANDVLTHHEKRQEFAFTFRQYMIQIVDAIARFESVQKSLGYEDVMSPEGYYMWMRQLIAPEMMAAQQGADMVEEPAENEDGAAWDLARRGLMHLL